VSRRVRLAELAGRHVWLDDGLGDAGRLLPADAPHVSGFDRGFQLGDAVFETMRARGGRIVELAEHVARLRRSAGDLEIGLPDELERRISTAVAALLAADHLDSRDADAAIRITVSRGIAVARGLLPAEAVPPTILVQAWPVQPAPAAHLERGLHLVASSVRRDPESPLAALKTTSRADYVYARLEARRAGADDAIFLTLDGHLSEATSANLFLVRGSRLETPHLGCAILPGTTRSWILGWAGGVGLEPAEEFLTTRDLAEADEAFVCSSVAGILPVTRFEGRPIGSGEPGRWTGRARRDRDAFIRGDRG